MHTTQPELSTPSEDAVFEFLEMSQRLLSIITNENMILKECGCLSMEAYMAQRDTLLRTFERKAADLLSILNGVNAKEPNLHRLMLAEIQSLQQALHDNTQQQFKSLERVISDQKGDPSWH